MNIDKTLASEVRMYVKAISQFKNTLAHLRANKRIFFYSKVHLMDTLVKNLRRSLNPRKDITYIRDLYQEIKQTYLKI